MIAFKSNEIIQNYSTIGDKLKNARIEQSGILEKISRKINIDVKYLRALEMNDYNKFSDNFYCKKILKKYVDFLNLDFESINNLLLEEMNIVKVNHKKTDIFLTKKIKWKNFIIFPKLSKGIIIIFLVLTCLSYLWFTLQSVFSPPELAILNPVQNNLVIDEKYVIINGVADPETKIRINDNMVLSDTDGEFSKEVNLKNGINNVVIVASKKYSKENIVKKQILVRN